MIFMLYSGKVSGYTAGNSGIPLILCYFIDKNMGRLSLQCDFQLIYKESNIWVLIQIIKRKRWSFPILSR